MIIKNLLLIVAMAKEAQLIIDKMGMKKIENALDPHLPADVYQAKFNEGKITLAVSGKCCQHGVDRIGSQGLNLLTWEAIKTFFPDIIINPGTGGGFNRHDAKPGDIFVS